MLRWIIVAALLAMLPIPALASGLDDARAALAAQSRGDLDDAIALYAKAIESGELGREHTVFALNNLGLAYDTKGEHNDAIVSFNAAIQLKPDYHRAYFNRGVAFASLGKYDQAIADYDRAIELEPGDPDIVKRRADSYLARGDFDLAIQDYDAVIAQNPTNLRALKGRGIAYMSIGRYDEAIADYDAALAIEPDNAEVSSNRVVALRAQQAALNETAAAGDVAAGTQTGQPEATATAEPAVEAPVPETVTEEPAVAPVAEPVAEAVAEPAPPPVPEAATEPTLQPTVEAPVPPPAPEVTPPPAAQEPVAATEPVAAPEPAAQPVVEVTAPEAVIAAAPAPSPQTVPEPAVTVTDVPMDTLLRDLYDRSATAFEDLTPPPSTPPAIAAPEPQPLVVASAPSTSASDSSIASTVPSLVLPTVDEPKSEFVSQDPNYYVLRGNSYKTQGLYNRAIADYDTAIRLDPNLPASYNNRGVAYGKLGMHQRAIDDYDVAIRLDANDFVAYKNRGNSNFYLGNFAAATRDFETLVNKYPDDAYRIIWLYLAQARNGNGDVSSLAARAARINPESWPGPVVELFLGEATPAEVLNAARQVEAKRRPEQECEAFFYLGQYELISGHVGEARRMFQQSVDTGVTNFIEYTGSDVELKRLAQSEG